MTDQETFATLARRRREALSMTQAMLAEAAGVTERTVQRVERGDAPSSETVKALCAVLDIPPPAARAALARSGHEACPTLAILPEPAGPVTGRMRDDALKILTRAHADLPLVVAPDQVAACRAYVPLKLLRRYGLDWSSRPHAEDVVEDAVARSVRFMLKRFDGKMPDTFQICWMLAWTLGAFVVIAFSVRYLYEVFEILGKTGYSLLFPASIALYIYLMSTFFVVTKMERAAGRVQRNEAVAGIDGSRLLLVRHPEDGVSEIVPRDVVRMSISDRGEAHFAVSLDLVTGTHLSIDWLPHVPEAIDAFRRIERAVAALDARTVPVLPSALAMA